MQGVYYKQAREGMWYADAWLVEGAVLSVKVLEGQRNRWFDLSRSYPTALCFVAGPNAGCWGRPARNRRHE